jgi:DNA-binding SARP family transcriptional activator
MVVDVANTRLQLLSAFEVRVDGRPLDLKPGSQRLLAYLALAGKAVGRAYTAFQLWPDKSEARAMANLRSAVWRLRQQPADLVDTTPTSVRLDPSVWVDARDGVRDLTVTIASSHRRGAPGVHGVDLLTTDLLPEWYDEWLVSERERLRHARLHLLEHWCRELIASGRTGDAIDLAFRAIAVEPLRESSHRLVLEAHIAEGNVAEAARHFDHFRRTLRRELGVDPSPELGVLVPALMPGGP